MTKELTELKPLSHLIEEIHVKMQEMESTICLIDKNLEKISNCVKELHDFTFLGGKYL